VTGPPDPERNAEEKTVGAQTALSKISPQAEGNSAASGLATADETIARLTEANAQLIRSTIQARGETHECAEALEEVLRTAELDALTGLPNRKLLLDRLSQAIHHAKRNRSKLALLFLDLDGFKQVNDQHGHAIGDEVLKQVAQCLTATVREEDTVSRRGGDEFVVLLGDVALASDAARIADKVVAAFGGIGPIGGHDFQVATSIGISVFPDDGEDADTLIDRADAAMYLAKRRGLDHYFFNSPLPVTNDEPYVSAPPPPRPIKHAPAPQREQDLQHARIREVNEQLVISTIAAQELQETAQHAQRRQMEFMAMMAHELCSPLMPISLAMARVEYIPREEVPQMRALIEREVKHISRLVGDLLDVARVNTGTLRLERRVVDLRQVIESVADACRPAMLVRQQHFELKLPERALTVRGDAIRLTQIVRNLLDNACKYTDHNGLIVLAAEIVGESVVITVSDSGIGISAEMLPYVFEPFKQDTRAIGFNGVGLGIGLKVVHDLVEAHAGTVVANSAGQGCGSRFVVTLPFLNR
jgi:diguanylate cyclase (GGDEF)-like protein